MRMNAGEEPARHAPEPLQIDGEHVGLDCEVLHAIDDPKLWKGCPVKGALAFELSAPGVECDRPKEALHVARHAGRSLRRREIPPDEAEQSYLALFHAIAPVADRLPG